MSDPITGRRVKIGMVGGGRGAFIGAVHRIALRLDDAIELAAGAFSSDPDKAKASAADLLIAPARAYGSFEEMLAREAALPFGERIDAVAIVTPNHMHFPVADAALRGGFHVICDKPVTRTLEEARALRETVRASGKLFALTHTYLGYPMVAQARALAAGGALGSLRKVLVEYNQGWLSRPEEADNAQAAWRTDPARSGAAGCMGDIGTHAHSLAEHVAGATMTELSAELNTFVAGRRLDDDGAALFRMSGGIKGVLHASQICAGEENGLSIRVYGDKGGLEWRQEEPNTLVVKWLDAPRQIFRAGVNAPGLDPAALAAARTPTGHPEGYLEAFANLYRTFAEEVRRVGAGRVDPAIPPPFPSIEEGVRGMAFIDAVVASSQANGAWTPIET